MSPDFVHKLSCLPKFPETAKDLIRVLGLEAATTLINAWGGQEYPVPAVIGGANKRGASRYRRILGLIGESAAAAMVKEYGGGMIAIPNLKVVKWSYIQETIRTEYDELLSTGLSSPDAVFELGIRYQVNGRAIERIIRQPSLGIHTQPQHAA